MLFDIVHRSGNPRHRDQNNFKQNSFTLSCPVIFTRSSTYGIRLHPDCLVFLTGKIHPFVSQFPLRSRHRYKSRLAYFFHKIEENASNYCLLRFPSCKRIQRANEMKGADKSVEIPERERLIDSSSCARRKYREGKIYYIRSRRKTHYMIARVRDTWSMRSDSFSCNDNFLDNGQINASNYVIFARKIDFNYRRWEYTFLLVLIAQLYEDDVVYIHTYI